jgi:hypothetical protein
MQNTGCYRRDAEERRERALRIETRNKMSRAGVHGRMQARTIFASESHPPPANVRIIALLAGLMAAAAVAWLLIAVVRLPAGTPLFVVAAVHVALIVAGNALGIGIAAGLLDYNDRVADPDTLAAAAWLGPLAVYLAGGSVFAVPMAAVLAAEIVTSCRAVIAPVEETVAGYSRELFRLPAPAPITKLWSLVFAAWCIEMSLAGTAAGATAIAMAFIAGGAAIIAWHVAANHHRNQSNAAYRLLSAAATVVLAFSLMAGGLGQGEGSEGNGDDTAVRLDGGSGGKYWGVVLLTDAPPPTRQFTSPDNPNRGLLRDGMRIPLTIRFDGVYWFFRPPDLQPPSDAAVIHGSPDETAFRSTDATPLLVEAHQKLPARFDLTCCLRINVRVRNADKFPGTVSLELFLLDSIISADAWISLGEVSLGSRRVVEYRIPEESRISNFDEVAFRFHLESSRETQSPRIAIQDMVMIPR